jgi:hypothetical protein
MKILNLCLVLGLVVVLAACTPSGSDRPVAVDYKQGTGGIELELLPGNPPREILEGGAFTIGVLVKNSGAYEITRGEVSIIGLNKVFNVLDKEDATMPFLQGRNFNLPEGEFYVEEFRGKNLFVPIGLSEYRAKFLVQAEYDYISVLNSDVCINPKTLLLEASDEICTVEQQRSFSGQGGPLVITNVEETVNSEGNTIRAQFKLTVENRGRGKVISPIVLDEVKVGPRRLDCGGRDKTRIDYEELEKKKKLLFVCKLVEPVRGAYTTTLSATLAYTYRTVEEGEFILRTFG